MTIDRMIELLKTEHECILRNSRGDCDRNCIDCELVQDDGELNEMYTNVVAMLKERKCQQTTAEIEGGGSTWWFVCRECRGPIDSYDKFCKHCGRTVVRSGRTVV